MKKELAELIKISNTVGSDPALVQGGGGNTSVKTLDGKSMYIKASGTALKDMDEKRGWRRLNLNAVLQIIQDKSLPKMDVQTRETQSVNRLLLACDDTIKDDSRPSVEAHLHALLHRCVIHLHPVVVGAYMNSKNGKAEIEKLFKKEKFPPLWIPATDPGFMLARRTAKEIADYEKKFNRKPSVIFLEKHGLFISSDNPIIALRLVKRIIGICSSKMVYPKASKLKSIDKSIINDAKLKIRKAFFEATGRLVPISYYYDKQIQAFMARSDAPKLLAFTALSPDELVYANSTALWVEKCNSNIIASKLTARINKGQKPPLAFLVKNTGLFVASEKKVASTIKDLMTGSFFIRSNALRLGGILALTKRQQDFINNWESEAFRNNLAKGASEGPLVHRLTIVTGAGSGLGRSIAIGLARAGASVAIADIDTNAAQQTSMLIKNELPQAQTMIVSCNVTDEKSVDNAFNELLTNWGGLDLLVNAAGVAPAGPLVDIPVDKWRFALEVNLTGYFLMARAAAKIMIRQAIGGSIINISSKSGLEASKNNTPYNATKAGEIHMARGWAMELGEHGIRVNCVCPGNVFEGSKIWNPQYLRTCAKKYGIKPEEVIPFYVNKTFLRREIKGQDVADAVVFLASEKSRTITGQIIVPDAGQVPVR